MNCFIVSLGCNLDDLIVRVCKTMKEAERLARKVLANPEPYHKDATDRHGLCDLSGLICLNIFTVMAGKVEDVRVMSFPETAGDEGGAAVLPFRA